MIAIALGANLPSKIGTPVETLMHALDQFSNHGLTVLDRSHWYETAPVPASDQPLYVNGVVSIHTDRSPKETLDTLLSIEDEYGRERGELNAARTLDLDILDFNNRVEQGPPILPHPRLENRGFVLFPLMDIAPRWLHPVSGIGVEALISELPDGDVIRRLL